ncbi:MAG TPA: hypothetical protein VE891_10465 [Allosphingosinicella sp.]|nr:hypothetical protein [Allosphingosinicella sp.]
MPPVRKAIIGFLLALAAAWVWHAPLGHGERLIDRLEGEARREVARSELPGIGLNFSRDPLARVATLNGSANALQREGLGSQKGVSDYARDVQGISDVRWADEAGAGRRVVPLLVETLGLAALAYLIGLGLGWLFWGRRREDFD